MFVFIHVIAIKLDGKPSAFLVMDTYVPVSYTHLVSDSGFVPHICRMSCLRLSTAINTPLFSEGSTYTAVSYTHLDVYKRQNPYWWDEENNRGYAWIVNFSTKNITTNHLSRQLSVSNNAGNQVSKPRFWKAEWSLTGDMDNEACLLYTSVLPVRISCQRPVNRVPRLLSVSVVHGQSRPLMNR